MLEINDKSNRRLRRNEHDKTPSPSRDPSRRSLSNIQQSLQMMIQHQLIPHRAPSGIAEVPKLALSVNSNSSSDPPHTAAKSPSANSNKEATPRKKSNDVKTTTNPADSTQVMPRSRSGRENKPLRNPKFVYNCL